VNDGLDALLKAAETNRDPVEKLVCYEAIEEIARRAYNMSQHTPPQTLTSPELEPALMRLAADEDPLIRGRTVYVLGKLGTPAAIARLKVMTDDADASTRFDAAVALAHRGNDNAVPTLAEMLDVDELMEATPLKEGTDPLRRSVIVASAIESVNELVRQNPSANLGAVVESLTKLAAADADALERAKIPQRAIVDAKSALEFVKSKQAEAAPAK
jgi:HEAT repeat protein